MLFISTESHGYLKISLRQFFKAVDTGFKVSNYSFLNSGYVLLEEDCDAPNFMKHIDKDPKDLKVKVQKSINKNMYYNSFDTRAVERLYNLYLQTMGLNYES